MTMNKDNGVVEGLPLAHVVTMQRWGDSETHNYVIGVFTNYWDAHHAGEVERAWRGGKYDALITPMVLDAEVDKQKEGWYKECTTDEYRNRLRANYSGPDMNTDKPKHL